MRPEANFYRVRNLRDTAPLDPPSRLRARHAGLRDWLRELARNDFSQKAAQLGRVPHAEPLLEYLLRLDPQHCSALQALGTALGQDKLLGAAIEGSIFDRDQAVTLERQHRASECRAIHDQLARK